MADEPDVAAVAQPNVIVRAIGWTADALITKPLAILGSIGKLRFRVWCKTADSFTLIDFDTRDVQQREADK